MGCSVLDMLKASFVLCSNGDDFVAQSDTNVPELPSRDGLGWCIAIFSSTIECVQPCMYCCPVRELSIQQCAVEHLPRLHRCPVETQLYRISFTF